MQEPLGQEPPQISGLTFERRLGQGGFADVFLYRQELPSMLVAVKVLRESRANLRDQLIAEANTMAELAEHPFIASILRAGVTDDGRAYLVMSYYPRPNLAERVRHQALSVPEVLRTGIQLASAVETAHRADILHRDIKPANVLVSGYRSPALADFGISGRGATVDDHDEVGVSVAWTAPEVLRGQSNGSVSADVYSLAATLSYLLSGRSPFEAPGGDNSSDAMLRRSLSTDPARTGRADVPESLERLLRQSLDKDPAVRPPSAIALARSLLAIEQELRLPRTEIVLLDEAHHPSGDEIDDVTTIRPTLGNAHQTPVDHRPLEDPATQPTPGYSRRGLWLALAAVAALVVVGAVVAVLTLSGDDQEGEQSTESTTEAVTAEAPQPTMTAEPETEPSPESTDPTSEETAAGTADDTEQNPAGQLDSCLIGTWETVEYSEFHPGIGEITSLERIVEITPAGRMLITYDEALAGGGQGLVFDGEVEYDIATEGETMSFELLRNEGTLSVGPIVTPLNPGVSDVTYTCEGDTFTQSTSTFNSVYARVIDGG